MDAFSAGRQSGPCAAAVVLAMSYDGEGIVMRPDALRQATAKAAVGACRKLATRLSPGERAGRKQMAELAVVYDAAPAPRTPADIIGAPGQDTGRARARTFCGAIRWPGPSQNCEAAHNRDVKHWQNGTMALRWCAAGMAEASKQFRRVNGQMPLAALRRALDEQVATQIVGAVRQDDPVIAA